jgi:hypothetical protein
MVGPAGQGAGATGDNLLQAISGDPNADPNPNGVSGEKQNDDEKMN